MSTPPMTQWEIVRDPNALIAADWQFLSGVHKDDPRFEQGKDVYGNRGGWIRVVLTAIVGRVGRTYAECGVIRRPILTSAAKDEGDRLLAYFVRTTPVERVLAAWPGEDDD